MIGLILILVFLILIVGIMFTPIKLEIDTANNTYLLQWKGIASLSLIPVPNDLLMQFSVFFWKKDFYPLHYQAKKKLEKPKKTKQKKVRSQQWAHKGFRLLKSFEIKAFQLNLDTDNFIQNSYLFPIFHLLDNPKRQMKINYKGDSELFLIVENRLYRMLAALWF